MMNYKISALLITLLCLWSTIIFGQKKTYKANYVIDIPIENQVASISQYEYLTNILKENYTGGNLFSNQSPFVLIPSIKIISEQVAGEVQIVKVIKIEIGLVTQGKNDNFTFKRFKQSYIITAENRSIAIDKALDRVNNEQKIATFFEQSNQKILEFYESNCSNVLNTVKVNIERKEYLKAFDFLRYVPEPTTCFQESEKLITKIYADSKEESCRILVQKALSEEAQRNYTKALYYLQFIDTGTTCYSSATSLVNKISERIDASVLRDFEMEKLKFSKLTDLQKIEIIAREANSIDLTIND
ncbi:hypothetical protein AV926_17635 [Myroides marinus]|uniref:DUF4476 domain-containing protein n=1 Tax=Myroides marinus TaxID=703342 RepID=A0A163VCI1_9FLAO|nr:hypothetical protein [Myroides marinus]KZE74696.1 hypothetical protein AV926_17635 [Myroides marinus]